LQNELDFGADDPLLQQIMHNIDKKKKAIEKVNIEAKAKSSQP